MPFTLRVQQLPPVADDERALLDKPSEGVIIDLQYLDKVVLKLLQFILPTMCVREMLVGWRLRSCLLTLAVWRAHMLF